jgi:hypothetical protein
MTTKPPQQKILQGILHEEYERKEVSNHRRRNQRVAVIWLHKIKSLNNKNN